MEYKQPCIREYLALAIFSFLVFCPSLKNGFVWDDKGIIFDQIHRLKGLEIYKPQSIYYRPLAQTSFLLDYLVWGYRPLGYHLTNIILHTANVLLFFILVRNITIRLKVEIDRFVPFLLALIFALHPVHVESVSWIAGRTDILVSLFSLLALIASQFYWTTRDKKLLLLVLVFFGLALASKEMAVVLVPILLIESFFTAPMFYQTQRDKIFNVCFLLIAGLALFYSSSKIPGLRMYGWHFDLPSLIKANGFYLKSLLFPWPFCSYMPYIPSWGTWVSAGFVLTTGLLFFLVFKENRLHAQSGLVYLIEFLFCLLPVLALIVFHIGATPVAWRYLYMPSIFFILGAGIWITRLKKPRFVLLGLCCCFFAITITHQSIWRDNFHFWREAIPRVGKDYAIPHHQYALALWKRGDLKEAEKHFILALKAKDIQAYPWEKAIVYTNLGRFYASQEKWQKAYLCFKRALYYNPQYKPALCSLGRLYYTLYQRNHKKELWQKAQKLLKKCH